MIGAVYNPLNSRLTARSGKASFSYEVAKTEEGSNHWCVTENNRNNARNVNFADGNANNNNKYNGNVVRAVAALGDCAVPEDFVCSVWEAYYDCLRGKTRSEQAIEYMQMAADDIPVLAYELWTRTYHPGTSTCFLVKYPKWREVFAAGFRDRIVHHWICLRLEPLFELRFREQGDVSFNCRKGYGTDAAVEYVAESMRRISDNYHIPAWVFRGDLVGFFMSINKDLLWYLLQRFMCRWQFREVHFGWQRYGLQDQPCMYWDILFHAVQVVVLHHPERDCVLNSPVSWWRHLQPNKSLFTSPTGEPIGNLTTQLFANFLMSFFIAFVRFLFRGKNYAVAQFVDDFLIICDDLRFLVDSIPKIELFLKQKLLLNLHKDKRYLQPVSHGVLFVGTYIKPGRLYLSNRTLARFKERCEGFGRMLNEGCNELDLQRIEQTLNSYMGFCMKRCTYRYRRTNIDLMGARFWRHYYIKGSFLSVRTKTKYKPIKL